MAKTSNKTDKNSKSKILKAIPNTEIEKVGCLNDKYIITQNPIKEQLTLWKRLEDGFEKIKTSGNPLEFDEIIPWEM